MIKMKNILKLLTISVLLVACNDEFLDRTPLSEIAPENSFKNASDLEIYTNSFYNDLPGFDGIIGLDKLSDNVLYNGIPLEQSGTRLVPGTPGSSGWSWSILRKINVFFKYYEQCNDAAARREYSGVASFFRAYFYYNKLKRFGDVPWYNQVIETSDSDLLLKPRDSRVFVTDKIIEDLDRAIANLNTKKASDRVSIWTALALKSRVCLFEGTYRKYRNLPGADALLTLAYQSAQRLMDEGPYSLYSTGNPSKDYRDLFASGDAQESEILLTRRYSKELSVVNSVNYYFTSPTQDDAGLTKSIVDTYLTNTGTPFTSDATYTTKTFLQETAGRDARLSQTVRTPGYIRIGGTTTSLPDFSASISGYQIVKYVADASQDGFEAGFLRYDDLMRWKNGKILEDRFKGMYFPSLGSFDLDGNGSLDVQLYTGAVPTTGPSQKIEIGGVITLSNGTSGNLVPFADRAKSFTENRDYLYPIPSGDILLNPNLVQNPNW
jgi:hypothetical protein